MENRLTLLKRRKIKSTCSDTIDKIHEHIDTNLNRVDYQMTDLCRDLQMSRLQIYRLLKKSHNTTFSDLLVNARIQRALYYLMFTDLHISEISISVGMKDPSYFTKVFKKYKETNPKKFRDSYLEEINID